MKYSDILQNDDPNNSLDLLMKRINKGKAFDDEIAGFISDRVMIEDKYYKDLQRLSKKQIPLEDEFMGGFGRVYKEYIKLNMVIADIHKKLTDVLSEAEAKMRARLTSQDLSRIRNTEMNFRKQLKLLNEKSSKIKKYENRLRKKSSSHYEKKLSDAQQAYEQMKDQYLHEVNPFFDDIEKSDEYRFTNMKDTFQFLNNNEKEIYILYNNITESFEARIKDLDIDLEIEQYCSELAQITQNRNFVSDTASYQTNNSSINIEYKEKEHNRAGSIATSAVSRSSSFHKPVSPLSSTFETTTAPPPEVDEEGYSIPPAVPQPWAITEEPNGIDDDDDDNDNENNEFGALENESFSGRKLKIEIKNEVIKDEENDTQEALSKIATRVPSLLQENPNPLSRNTIARRRRTIASATSTDEDKFRYSYYGGNIDSPNLDWRKSSFSKPVSDPSLLSKKSGMKISVKEKMNTLIENDVVSKLAIFGDIYVSFSTIPQELLQNQYYFKIKINNYEFIKQAVPNPNYIVKQDTDQENEFTCNLTALLAFASQNINSSVAILKYQIDIDNDQKSKYLPLYVNPIWKSEPTTLSLLLAYQLNTSNKIISASEIRFFISLYGDIRNVQLKPHGLWNNEKKRLIWKDDNVLNFSSNPSVKGNSNENLQLEDATKELDGSTESLKSPEMLGTRKLMARFETGEQCPYGNINVQFYCNSTISTVGVSIESDEPLTNLLDMENVNYNTAIKYIIINNN